MTTPSAISGSGTGQSSAAPNAPAAMPPAPVASNAQLLVHNPIQAAPNSGLTLPAAATPKLQATTSSAGSALSQTSPQSTTVLVAPKEPSIIKELQDELTTVGQIAFGLWASWKPILSVWNKLLSLYNAVLLHVENLRIPDKGCYGDTGHGPTDARVKQLISEQKKQRENLPILISGSDDVGMFLIAKSLAAQVNKPLINICCGQLSNTEGKLSAGLVSAIALRALWFKWRYWTTEVVLVLDGLEALASTNQEPFVEQLKKSLGTSTSSLRKRAIVVGITYTEEEKKCSPSQVTLLEGLKYSFGRQLPVEPPKTATERYNLLRTRISSLITYQSDWKEHQLSSDDHSFLISLARAMPEIATDNRLIMITEAVIEASRINGNKPITGAQFKSVVLEKALQTVKNNISSSISNPQTVSRDACAVICEALVAHALGRTLMALGVQARLNKSYVCRERLDEGDITIGDLLKEAVALQSRRLSYSLNHTGVVSVNAPTREIADLDAKIGNLIDQASQATLQTCQGQVETDQEAIRSMLSKLVFKTADEMLRELVDGENKKSFDALLAKLSPTDPAAEPVELKNGALTEAIETFNFENAQVRAKSQFGL